MLSPADCRIFLPKALDQTGAVLALRQRWWRNPVHSHFPVAMDRGQRLALLASLETVFPRRRAFSQSWHPADYEPMAAAFLELTGLLPPLPWSADRRLYRHASQRISMVHVDTEALVLHRDADSVDDYAMPSELAWLDDSAEWARTENGWAASAIDRPGLACACQWILKPLTDPGATQAQLERNLSRRIACTVSPWPAGEQDGLWALEIRPLPGAGVGEWFEACTRAAAVLPHSKCRLPPAAADPGRALGILSMARRVGLQELLTLSGQLLFDPETAPDLCLRLATARVLALRIREGRQDAEKCSTLEEKLVVILRQLGIGGDDKCSRD